MAGKRVFHTFKEAENSGPYDEYPMLPTGIDPQIHLSRNDRPQPFYLICEKDCVLVQMSGEAKVDFVEGPARFFDMEPGDFVYVPGGTPHRVVPESESIQYRYKAEKAGLEGVAWYCPECGTEVTRNVWDTEKMLPQEGYVDACESFNENDSNRTCPKCKTVHPKADVAGTRWAEIAEQVRTEAAAEK